MNPSAPIKAANERQSGKAVLSALLIVLSVSAVFYYLYSRKSIPQQQAHLIGDRGVTAIENGPTEKAAISLNDSPPLPPDQALRTDALREAGEALKKGELDRAQVLLRGALALEPGSNMIKSMLANALNKSALKKADSGDITGAAALFEEASSLSPNPSYAENLAAMRVMSGDLDGAAQVLERLQPSPQVNARLKDIYSRLAAEQYGKGEAAGALKYLRKASETDPSDAKLLTLLARAEKEGAIEEKMGSNEASHFLVRFEGGENAIAGHLIGLLLEEAYIKVGRDLDMYPSERIEALLYSKEVFRDITRSPSWAGAIFDGRIKIPAGGITEKTAELEKVIFHEYAHAVVKGLAKGRAPVWFNEGIAQFEEGRTTSEYGSALSELASKGKLSLRPLEGSFMAMRPQEAQAAYAISLSATEYIIREFGLFSVRNILENLGNGMGMDEAIRSAVYISYEDLEKSWADSLKVR